MSRSKNKLLRSKAEAFRRNSQQEHYINSALCKALAACIVRTGVAEAKVGYKNGEFYEETIG